MAVPCVRRTYGAGYRSGLPNPAAYKTVMCQNYGSGRCSYGARCAFAHGVDELRNVRLTHCAVAKTVFMPSHILFARSSSDSVPSCCVKHGFEPNTQEMPKDLRIVQSKWKLFVNVL